MLQTPVQSTSALRRFRSFNVSRFQHYDGSSRCLHQKPMLHIAIAFDCTPHCKAADCFLMTHASDLVLPPSYANGIFDWRYTHLSKHPIFRSRRQTAESRTLIPYSPRIIFNSFAARNRPGQANRPWPKVRYVSDVRVASSWLCRRFRSLRSAS